MEVKSLESQLILAILPYIGIRNQGPVILEILIEEVTEVTVRLL